MKHSIIMHPDTLEEVAACTLHHPHIKCQCQEVPTKEEEWEDEYPITAI